MNNNVSLQISLAPNDYSHAKFLLKHQLDVLSSQVNEIILTIDSKRSKGRFGDKWEENKIKLTNLLEDEISGQYNVIIDYVDYSESIKQEIAKYFFDTSWIPEKDFRGGPFYSYFYGIYKTKNKFVLHLDSDMFLGGQSNSWVKEAVNQLERDSQCMIVSPLPGPPHPDGVLIDQPIIKEFDDKFIFQIEGISTRIFLLKKDVFVDRKLKLDKPSLFNQCIAIVEGNTVAELPEILLSHYMKINNFHRIDFLGPGLWSLHPPFRTPYFYNYLPELIKRVEQNDFPKDQYGFYDIIDSVCDWSSARSMIKRNRWKRLFNRFR